MGIRIDQVIDRNPYRSSLWCYLHMMLHSPIQLKVIWLHFIVFHEPIQCLLFEQHVLIHILKWHFVRAIGMQLPSIEKIFRIFFQVSFSFELKDFPIWLSSRFRMSIDPYLKPLVILLLQICSNIQPTHRHCSFCLVRNNQRSL